MRIPSSFGVEGRGDSSAPDFCESPELFFDRTHRIGEEDNQPLIKMMNTDME